MKIVQVIASTARLVVAGGLVAAVSLAGCDFLDPTEVSNPRTTQDELADAPEPTAALLPGLRAQFARALNAVVVAVGVASDSYSSHRTGLGGDEIDFPNQIAPNVGIISSAEGFSIGVYWHLQELRALCDFVIDEIAPDDTTASDAQLAEARYYRGMAFLMQGENFVAVPVEENGEPLPAGDLLQRAVADLTETERLDAGGEFGIRSLAALARAHRALGNVAEAAQFAQAALDAGGTDFLYAQEYDNATDDGTLDNLPQEYLVERSLKEMQPLPRLDFLDPKYPTDVSAIPVAKAEEMYLIQAEVAMAGGDYVAGRDRLIDAVTLTLTRPTETLEDDDERLDDDLTIRPRSEEILVAADADSPFRAGLVLTRPGPVEVPVVSGTSITVDSLNAVPTTEEAQFRRLLYTMRQEIMLLEGRRLQDLGIRLPMMQREIDANPNIAAGDMGTVVMVPAYIPGGKEMGFYSPRELYDPDQVLTNNMVTIMHDMNRAIAEQRGLVIQDPRLP